MINYNKILVIQTAFIGDVILATSLLETLNLNFPKSKIDILVRKGNESLFNEHPFINQVIVWNKKDEKIKNLIKVLKNIRKEKYDIAIGIQRFFNAGLLTAFSKAKLKIGFDKNPLSPLFHKKIKHKIGTGIHEVDRNYSLVKEFAPHFHRALKLHPSIQDYQKTDKYQANSYIVIAPASVWFTKQYPKEKWVEFLTEVQGFKTLIIGAPSDKELANEIINNSKNSNIENLCGKLNLLQSAALMRNAKMCYVNDSAPQHLASSVNANTTALFCSTVSSFGFGPLSENSVVIENDLNLTCRPCGLHGHKECPKKHFDCGHQIKTEKLLERLN